MDKKAAFKEFAKTHPELINTVKKGDTSWQKLYEIYDIYGEDDRAWNNYFNVSPNKPIAGIGEIMKNIDMDSVQKHINTAQKALGLVQELTGKSAGKLNAKTPVAPRPINKFFED